VVGFLRTTTAAPFAPIVAEFRKGLSEEGFVEGRNVAIEKRWADNQPDRLPGLAANLVSRKVAVIVVNTPAVVEATRVASPTVPIVFVSGDDPVKMGLVASLNRPEGNLTGVTFFGGSVLGAKRLELLHELVPKIAVVAVLLDPDTAFEVGLIETAARALGLQIVLVKLASERDLDAAFARIVAMGAGTVLFGGGPVLRSQLQQLVELAARHAIPTIYELRDYVEAGGLVSEVWGRDETTQFAALTQAFSSFARVPGSARLHRRLFLRAGERHQLPSRAKGRRTMTRDQLERLFREAKAALKKYPGVIGVGCGRKERGGQVIDQIAFRVYVKAKAPEAELAPCDVIPRAYGDLEPVYTDIVAGGGSGIACSSTPDIFAGDQISRDIPNAPEGHGTLGVIVAKGGKRFMLTCEHVFRGTLLERTTNLDVYKPEKQSCNKPVGTVRFDNGFVLNTEDFHLAAFPGISFKVDATLANINAGVKSGNVNKNVVGKISQFGPGLRNLLTEFSIQRVTTEHDARALNATVAAKKIEVRKFGATTGFTKGLLVGICNKAAPKQTASDPDFTFELAIVPQAGEPDTTETYMIDASKVDEVAAAFDATQLLFQPTVTFKADPGPSSDQRIITLKGKAFSRPGDSGSIIVDATGQIVGMLQKVGGAWIRDLKTNKDAFGANGVTFAQLIVPAFDAMGLPASAVIPPGEPQAGAAAVYQIDEDPPEVVEQRIFDAAEAAFGRTQAGQRLLRLARMHLAEIRFMLHHRRHVTVAWHRNKGPAYMTAIARAVRHPGRAVPNEIDGVRLSQAMRIMRQILFLEGSVELKESLEEHGDWLIDLIERATSGEEALRILTGDHGLPAAPASPSVRIINAKGVPGTIGAIVRGNNNALKFLTNHHVLFGDGAIAGDKVCAVEERNGRTHVIEIGATVSGHIGRVFYDGAAVFVDCAVGVFTNPERLPASLQDRLRAMVQFPGVADGAIGGMVTKDGAATGQTAGCIVDVAYPDVPLIDGRRYDAPRQLLIKPLTAAGLPPNLEVNFCAAGDSGAAVLDEHRRIVGLLWGANANGEGIACPIRPALEALEVELATDLSSRSPVLAVVP
jgi:ABC-type uncharacterized transport system substrate-binding protein